MDDIKFGLSIIVILVCMNYIFGRLKLYSDQRQPGYLHLYMSIVKSSFLSFSVLVVGIFIFHISEYSRLFLSIFFTTTVFLLSFQRSMVKFYFDKFAGRRFYRHQLLVVGDNAMADKVIELMNSQLSWGHSVVGRLAIEPCKQEKKDVLGTIEDLPSIIKRYTIDEVVFAINGYRNINLQPYINACKTRGISIRILPSLWCQDKRFFSVDVCQNVPFLTISSHNLNANGLLYKRALDIIGGMIGTVLVMLMFPLIALAIKIDSTGPTIFKQQRIGQNGRRFKLYKFRSMYTDAEDRLATLEKNNEMNGAMFKMKNDPRITRVGRWLRNTSLDEFPQFINVLKGEMSLVGTRPPTTMEITAYRDEHFKRISLKPGLTGLWQISGRNQIKNFDQVVSLDLKYMENWRFFDDIKILFRTVTVVLQRKGAV